MHTCMCATLYIDTHHIAGYFHVLIDFRGTKFRFSIDIAQIPPMTINFRELNIRGMALYHEKHDN